MKTKWFLVFGVIVILVLAIGVILFVLSRTDNYRILNQYYGFYLKTPKSWVAEGVALYSEENIDQILLECKNDKSDTAPVYEIGRFRFKSQRYPQGFGDMGNFMAGFPSGAILDITVSCLPDNIKDKIADYSYSNLEVGGAKAFEAFLNLPEFGKTKYLSFIHNNFQYKISEYIYISPNDKGNNENRSRENYADIFNKIISSFKFIDSPNI